MHFQLRDPSKSDCSCLSTFTNGGSGLIMIHQNHTQDEPGLREDPAHPNLLYFVNYHSHILQIY
jgi:hypothetical protein